MERIAATLFGKTRRAVLAKLFMEPEREFRLRELSRLTGISAGSVQHELRQLVGAEIVRRDEERDLVTYRANRACPVFEELQGLVAKTSGIAELIRDALRKAAGRIRLALVYGSVAKGVNRSRSDVDVLVVGSLSFEKLMLLLRPVEERIGREISPRLFSEKEFKARLARRDRFLTSIMGGPVVMLIGKRNDA
jgi:predicted nucleotidyltransferase